MWAETAGVFSPPFAEKIYQDKEEKYISRYPAGYVEVYVDIYLTSTTEFSLLA